MIILQILSYIFGFQNSSKVVSLFKPECFNRRKGFFVFFCERDTPYTCLPLGLEKKGICFTPHSTASPGSLPLSRV